MYVRMYHSCQLLLMKLSIINNFGVPYRLICRFYYIIITMIIINCHPFVKRAYDHFVTESCLILPRLSYFLSPWYTSRLVTSFSCFWDFLTVQSKAPKSKLYIEKSRNDYPQFRQNDFLNIPRIPTSYMCRLVKA